MVEAELPPEMPRSGLRGDKALFFLFFSWDSHLHVQRRASPDLQKCVVWTREVLDEIMFGRLIWVREASAVGTERKGKAAA
jgi:hypothetical protein